MIYFILVIQKISFGDLPKFSGGENQLAHRILCTRFSEKHPLDIGYGPSLGGFFQFQN